MLCFYICNRNCSVVCAACSVCDESKPVEGLRSMFLYTNEVDVDKAWRSFQVVRLQGKNLPFAVNKFLLDFLFVDVRYCV